MLAGWSRTYQYKVETKALVVSEEVKNWITEVFVDGFGKEIGDVFSRQVIKWVINGLELKEEREKRGISALKLAKLIGWNYNQQRKLEKGKTTSVSNRVKCRIEGALSGEITFMRESNKSNDIAFWRNCNGLTQKEFAEIAGWDKKFQRRLEAGLHFSYSVKEKLIEVFSELGYVWDDLRDYYVNVDGEKYLDP